MTISEFELIRRYFANSEYQFSRAGIELGIGDDGALLKIPADQLLVMSMDVLVDSIHFPPKADPRLIAQRSLAVNLSDMAAMAAEPLCFTLGLTLPEVNEKWLTEFSAGLLQMARQHNCPLVGGDTSRGPLQIAIQVQGLVAPDKVMRRSGAHPGDSIYVSGHLGDGAIALLSMNLPSSLGKEFAMEQKILSEADRSHFLAAYYQPEPRLELARALAGLATSGIDISDGLAGDLGHILQASAVGAVLQIEKLPFSDAAIRNMSASNRQLAALFGGDDYELCVTVAPALCAQAEAAASALGIPFTRIGEIVDGSGMQCVNLQGKLQEFHQNSFQHFR